jgi:hypothetical protein
MMPFAAFAAFAVCAERMRMIVPLSLLRRSALSTRCGCRRRFRLRLASRVIKDTA